MPVSFGPNAKTIQIENLPRDNQNLVGIIF